MWVCAHERLVLRPGGCLQNEEADPEVNVALNAQLHHAEAGFGIHCCSQIDLTRSKRTIRTQI